MLGKTQKYHLVNLFQTQLKNFINMEHELIQLADAIDWDAVEVEFKGNPFDGHTLPEQLDQIKRLSGMSVKNALVDRGYRGRKWIEDTKVEIPGTGKPTDSYYTKQKARKKFCRRAGIEPVIGHIKQDHRMQCNYLKGTLGDVINTMLATAGYNLKHWLNIFLSLKRSTNY